MRRVLQFIACFLIVLSPQAHADSNNNPCIQNWQPVAMTVRPGVSATPVNSSYTVVPGGTVNICFNYVIANGLKTERDASECAGVEIRTLELPATFEDGTTTLQVCVSYTATGDNPRSRVAYVLAPAVVVKYIGVNGVPQSELIDPAAICPVIVVAEGDTVSDAAAQQEWFPEGDSDNDGLNDAWEILHFTNLAQGPLDDPDGDKVNNLQEANFGMNPLLAEDVSPIWKIENPPVLPTDINPIRKGSVLVKVGGTLPIAQIRYTLDGTIPTTASPLHMAGSFIEVEDNNSSVVLKIGVFINNTSIHTHSFYYNFAPSPASTLPPPHNVYWGMAIWRLVTSSGATVAITRSGMFSYRFQETPGANEVDVGGWDYSNMELVGSGWIYTRPGATWINGVIIDVTTYPPRGGDLLPLQSGSWFSYPNHDATLGFGTAGFITSGFDCDTDGLSDAVEVLILKTNALKADTDGDGLMDYYEHKRGYLNPLVGVESSFDLDGDGKTLDQETAAGTNPLLNDLDMDGDGLATIAEATYGTNPGLNDTDNDGLPDAFEISIGSNPLIARQEITSAAFKSVVRLSYYGWKDSDGDWMPDAYESLYSFLNARSSADATQDNDADGLTNYQEYKLGTRPDIADSDGDGVPDGWELGYGLNPKSADDAVVDTDVDGLINRLEWQFNSDPNKADGDVTAAGQQIPHPVTGVINTGDGLSDLEEILLGLDPLVYDTQTPSHFRTGLTQWSQSNDSGTDADSDGFSDLAESVRGTDPALVDTDEDTMPDAWEVFNGLNPMDLEDAAQDKDSDGLTNLREYQLGLIPYDYDTDNDGLGDGWEVAQGLDTKSGRTGLVAWWRFDGAGNVFNDSGRLEHDGLLRGAASQGSSGRVEGALSLDGKDAYAVVKDHADLSLDTSCTLAFWFKPEAGSLSTPRQLLDKLGSYTLEVVPADTSNRLVFTWLIDGESHTAASTASLVEGAWNHIVLIIDRDTDQIRFHINGAADSVHTADLEESFDSSPWPLLFGSQRVLPMSRTTKGLLDDVRLYNQVLSGTVLELLANPVDPANPSLYPGSPLLDSNLNRDGDGLTELQEYLAGSDPLAVDTDGDGLSDSEEVTVHHTDPRLMDTDGDGLTDYAEIFVHHTNPRSQDTDGDDLNDYDEVMIYHTSSALTVTQTRVDREGHPRPDGWDSDGDGIPDGWEAYYQFNPADAADKLADPDGDGLTNLREYQLDKRPRYPDDVSPGVDGDGDKLSDWAEKYEYHTDPNKSDTFGDGLGDLYRVQYQLLDANNPDHSATADVDHDGANNKQEKDRGTSPLDPKNLSAVAMAAVAVAERPDKGEIAYNAPEPDPVLLPGQAVALAYRPGDLVLIYNTQVDALQLIAAVDRISVKAVGGTASPLQLTAGMQVKSGVSPSDNLGANADVVYEYHDGYDITEWVKNLPVDENGLVHFELVAEVDPLFEREPPPPTPEEPGAPEEPSPGGSGGGWGSSWLVGGESGRGGGSTAQPALAKWKPPAKPTYALSQMTASIIRGLRVDANRDGHIKLASEDPDDDTTQAKPFRFWSNDDDDQGPAAGDNMPGQPDNKADYNNAVVDSARDLVDFFPVYLDINQLLAVLPHTTAGITYKLKQADGALNFVYTNLTNEYSAVDKRSKAFDYQYKVLTTGFGPDFTQAAGSATTERITAAGVPLNTTFLDGIKNNNWGVILVEGRAASTAPLRLVVEKAGVEVAEVSLNLKMSPVEQMFRHVNLTNQVDEYATYGSGNHITPPLPGIPTNTEQPVDYPDSLTNGKYFVFLHGFNVDADSARGWNAEIFKRMHTMGSEARFVGVLWNGSPPLPSLIAALAPRKYLDYHKAVFQALQTGDLLANALSFTNGADVTVAAHSLGNIVTSHAIQNGGFTPTRYYMIDAAAAIEAYSLDDAAGQFDVMRHRDWVDYNPRLYASKWHELFVSSDNRSAFTWKLRFANVLPRAHNFFSGEEDVVANGDQISSASILTLAAEGDLAAVATGEFSWKLQELVKGNYLTSSASGLVIERRQGGWEFNIAWDKLVVLGNQADLPPEQTVNKVTINGIVYDSQQLTPQETESITNEELKNKPFFRNFDESDWFNTISATKAGETKVKYDVLARAIPAMSHAVAANRLNSLGENNYDMPSSAKKNGWHNAENRWRHSDFCFVALPYVYPMFQEMISRGGLNQ